MEGRLKHRLWHVARKRGGGVRLVGYAFQGVKDDAR